MKYIILSDSFANKLKTYNGATVDYQDIFMVYGVSTDAFIKRNINKLVKEVKENKNIKTEKPKTVETKKEDKNENESKTETKSKD